MNEERKQQIIMDKLALNELRDLGIEISPDESRSPSQILKDISRRVVEQTIQITEKNGIGGKL